MAAALTPRRASCRVSRLAPLLLLQKIMTCFSPRKRISRAAASALSFSSISYTSWRTLTAVALRVSISIETGSFKEYAARFRISSENVAENSSVCRSRGSAARIFCKSGRNPYPASGPLHQAPVYRFGPIEGFFVPDDQADGPALRPEFRRRAAIHPLALSYRRRQKRPGCAAACIGHKRGY